MLSCVTVAIIGDMALFIIIKSGNGGGILTSAFSVGTLHAADLKLEIVFSFTLFGTLV